MTSWGAGTRRLASLEIAAANQKGAPVILVDEIERGLEPHRQRTLMRLLASSGNQVFVTTHSPIVLSCALEGSLWYLDAGKRIGKLTHAAAGHVRHDPEAFLATLPVVAEGATEVGFLRHLLDLTLDGLTLERGVWVTDSRGHDNALPLLEAVSGAGVIVGGFVDDEGRGRERWKALAESMGALLFQWKQGCLEQNVIRLIPEARLLDFVEDPTGELTGERLQTLRERLNCTDKDWPTLLEAADDITTTIAEAASGVVPEWVEEKDLRKRFKGHARKWFKSEEGGRELAQKCSDLRLWSSIEPQLLPVVNAIREVVTLEPLAGIPEPD
jgi:putative ATP-dependent endonuclease of OLD family